MNYTNLAKNPVYFSDTIKLIEESFSYSSENHFDIDFYPLTNKDNFQNCHLLIEDGKVLAHVGVLNKEVVLNEKTFNVSMYGGIAVAKDFQGKGLFKKLFNDVLNKQQDSALHLLWSDQIEMYEKFNFYPAIEQFEYNQNIEDASDFTPTKLSTLSEEELLYLKAIYDNQGELRLSRSIADWKVLTNITSTDLYLKRHGDKIINYFFMNKGEDLAGVIIEVGSFEDIAEIERYGITWAPYDLENSHQEPDVLFAAMLKIGSHKLFSDFINIYTNHLIDIVDILPDSIEFKFEGSLIKLNHTDFLTGVFGPNRFGELKSNLPFYISGLDSI